MRRRDDIDSRPAGTVFRRVDSNIVGRLRTYHSSVPPPPITSMLLFKKGGLCARVLGVHMGFSYVLTLFYGVGGVVVCTWGVWWWWWGRGHMTDT